MAISCPYCSTPAELVTGDVLYPHRPDLASLKFWRCSPCGAHVGCHKRGAVADGIRSDGTLPLGRLANAELRRAKSQAHALFDEIWKSRRMGRRQAYAWLAKKLGIPQAECHIGMFDVDRCREVVRLIKEPSP